MADWNGFKKNGTTYIPNDATARERISTIEGKIPSAASSSNKLVDTSTMTTELNGKVNVSSVGANNGVAGLDANGRVPSSQLPSYVDDVLEYDSQSDFPATGETGKIYIALDTNKTFRWSGSAYVEISESLALGETSSTAYAGNKGKANADAISTMKDGSSIDSFGDVETALAGKVDKVTGKGLSTNDYDNTAKAVVTTAQDNIIANTKLIKDTVGWSGKNKANFVSGKGINSSGEVIDSTGRIATVQPITIESGMQYKYVSAVTENIPLCIYAVWNGSTLVRREAAIESGTILNTSGGDKLYVCVYGRSSASVTIDSAKAMVIDADILDSTYEPYFGSTAFPRSEQAVLGARNIIKNTATSGTYSNVVATVNSDKTISLSGISNSNDMSLFIMGKGWGNNDKVALSDTELVVGESYILHKGFSLANTNLGIRFYNSSNVDIGGVLVAGEAEKQRFTIPAETASIVCFFRATSGTDVTGKVLKPMITLDTDTDDNYSEPVMTNKELTEKVAITDYEIVSNSGLVFVFFRSGNVVTVNISGESTSAFANDANIVAIPEKYRFYRTDNINIISYEMVNSLVKLLMLSSGNIKANTPIAVGDKLRGSFSYITS